MRFLIHVAAVSMVLATPGAQGGEMSPPKLGPAAAGTRRHAITEDDVNLAIQRAIEFILSRQEVDGRWISPESETECPNCLTALAAYTLHKAGVPLSNRRLQRAVQKLWDRTGANTVPARSFTLMLWCALQPESFRDPEVFKRQRVDDIRFLRLQQNSSGGWGLTVRSGPGAEKRPADNSNSQLALLALSEAATADLKVSAKIWREAEGSWLGSANPDGGWGYLLSDGPEPASLAGHSMGSMTAGGLASLYIIYDQLYLDAESPFNGRFKAKCGQDIEKTRPIRKAMDRAWQWLGEHYRPDAVAGPAADAAGDLWETYLTSYLFGLGRVGVTSGRKRIGSFVWYQDVAAQLLRTQQDDGSWGNPAQTCFGVLALVEGRTPVLINKLKYGDGDAWNTDRRDAANLTRWFGRRVESAFTWQVVELGTDPEDVYDAPVLLITGHEAPSLSDAERAKLRDFVHAGGTVLAVACCSRPDFAEGCRALFRTMFPRFEAGLLPADHPVWTILDPVEPGEDCYGFGDDCRTSVFILDNGACCAWQQNLIDREQRRFSLGGNILGYATFNHPPPGRSTPYFDRAAVEPLRKLEIARLIHGGDWWANPEGMERFSATLSARNGLGLDEGDPVRAEDLGGSGAGVLWVTGYRFGPFSAAGRAELEAFLKSGGTLVANASCGSTAFDAPFQDFAVDLFGPEAWQRIPADDPIMTGSFAPGLASSLQSMSYRPRHQASPPPRLDWPILHGIRHEGRWVVIYSPYDLAFGISRHNCLDCVGYVPRDAEAVLANIMLYVAQRQLLVERASKTTSAPPEPAEQPQ